MAAVTSVAPAPLADLPTLAGLLPVATFAVDVDACRFLWLNAAAERLTGRTWRDLVSRDCAELLPLVFAEDRAALEAVLSRFAASGAEEPLAVRFRLVGPEGEIRWLEVRGLASRSATGARIAVGVALDAGEPMAFEEEIRDALARLSLVADAVHDGIWERELSTGRDQFSDRAHELLALPPGSLELGFPAFRERLEPEGRERLEECLNRALGSRDRFSVELGVLKGDGERGTFLLQGRTVFDPSGRPVRMAGSITDVTEARRVESRLRESEERHRLLAENASDVITLLRPDGTIVYASPSLRRVLGLWPKELVGHRAFERVDAADLRAVRRAASALRRGRESSVSFRARHRDGRWIWLESRAQPLRDPDGNVVEVVAVLRDVSERVAAEEERLRLEAQVRHAQKMESLGILAGGIAHDFNNLLVGMLGNASLALLELAEGTPGRERVELLERSARRAAELTRQLLAYSGRGRLLVAPVSLTALARDTADLLTTAVSRKARLALELDDEEPWVEADETQLRQVLMNLLTNASEALGDGSGTIHVRTAVRWEARAALADVLPQKGLAEGSWAVLEVEDDGCGMDAATRERIFDPFFTTKLAGRGLGLAAVLGIVRGHGGALRVTSAPGRGTTVTVLLPRIEPPPPRRKPPATPYAVPAGTQALVIDDEDEVRLTCRRLLEAQGFVVREASDGEAAIVEARKGGLSAVLLDLTMPEPSGDVTFARLSEIAPGLPVVVMSGYSEPEVRARCGGEATFFLQKPFGLEELSELMSRALGPGVGALDGSRPLDSGEKAPR